MLSIGALGEPVDAGPAVFASQDPVALLQWESNLDEIRGGKYLDRFLWLFTPGLERLNACLEAWPFLVEPCDDRVIIGRNAYGAIGSPSSAICRA